MTNLKIYVVIAKKTRRMYEVLLTEDDIAISNAVKQILEYAKFNVMQVFDGQSAFECALKDGFDVIILDVMMPKMNGFEVLKSLRDDSCDIPVLMLTALGQIDDKVNGLDLGADDYLTKPFDAKELVARINTITRRNVSKNNILTFGNLTLNPNTFEISANGSTPLTNKEFKLLELLLNSQSKLVSSEQILEKVWGYDSESEINVVWVFISSIRKKLEQIQADSTIKAVRGIGYKLERL